MPLTGSAEERLPAAAVEARLPGGIEGPEQIEHCLPFREHLLPLPAPIVDAIPCVEPVPMEGRGGQEIQGTLSLLADRAVPQQGRQQG